MNTKRIILTVAPVVVLFITFLVSFVVVRNMYDPGICRCVDDAVICVKRGVKYYYEYCEDIVKLALMSDQLMPTILFHPMFIIMSIAIQLASIAAIVLTIMWLYDNQ